MTDRLLDVADIAALWGVTLAYAKRHLVKLPEFPEPAPGSTRKTRRWRESDVQAFLRGEAEQPA